MIWPAVILGVAHNFTTCRRNFRRRVFVLCGAFWFLARRRKTVGAVEKLGELSQNYLARRNFRRCFQFYGGPSKNCARRFGFRRGVAKLWEPSKIWESRCRIIWAVVIFGGAHKFTMGRWEIVRSVLILGEASQNRAGRRKIGRAVAKRLVEPPFGEHCRDRDQIVVPSAANDDSFVPADVQLVVNGLPAGLLVEVQVEVI